MPNELRDALESAVEQVEQTTPPVPAPEPAPPAAPTPAPPPIEKPEAPVTGEPKSAATPVAPATAAPKPVQQSGPTTTTPPVAPVDSAPKSWKAPVAAKWATVDPEVKAEINRREKEITKAFGENNQVREFHRQFQEVVRPYQAHLQNYGKPLEAIANLLQVEYALNASPPVAKAQLMAKLIKDYGIDIKELDSALAGEQADPVKSSLEQLLEQKLSPIQTFMQRQQELDSARQQRVRNDAAAEVEKMGDDPATYPHFEEVREDMADVIEMNARRGRYLTPVQAYQLAVNMNPAWAAEGTVTPAAAQQQQLSASDARAQKALQASASVKSQPSSTPMHVNNADSLRGTIESAFEQVTSR